MESVIYEQALVLADQFIKAHSFLLMWIHKRRYLKIRASQIMISKIYRGYRSRKNIKKLQ